MPRKNPERWLYQIDTELRRHAGETPNKPQIARQKGWSPRVDVQETASMVIVKAELAGVHAEQVRLSIAEEGPMLVLRGVRREPDGLMGECVTHQLEIDYGEFRREIELPVKDLKLAETRGMFKNGMLVISIPKEKEGFESQITIRRTIKIEKL